MKDRTNAASQTDRGRDRAALRVRPLPTRKRPRSRVYASPGQPAAEMGRLHPAARGLAAGDRVRVTWSGKVGTVVDPIIRTDRYWPGTLVLLDPFTPFWSDSEIAGLEVIYSPHDLTPL